MNSDSPLLARFLKTITASLILVIPSTAIAQPMSRFSCESSYEYEGTKITSGGTITGRIEPFEDEPSGYILKNAKLKFDGFGVGKTLGFGKAKESPICDNSKQPNRSQCNSSPSFPGGIFVMYVYDVTTIEGDADSFQFVMDKRLIFLNPNSPLAKRENWHGSCAVKPIKNKQIKS